METLQDNTKPRYYTKFAEDLRELRVKLPGHITSEL